MSEEDIKLEMEKLKEAFKPVQDILAPYSQDGEMLEYEESLLKHHEKLLMLKKQMYKVQKDIQTDSAKLKVFKMKHVEYLKSK